MINSFQRTGVTSVVVYAPTLFKIAGFSPHKVILYHFGPRLEYIQGLMHA